MPAASRRRRRRRAARAPSWRARGASRRGARASAYARRSAALAHAAALGQRLVSSCSQLDGARQGSTYAFAQVRAGPGWCGASEAGRHCAHAWAGHSSHMHVGLRQPRHGAPPRQHRPQSARPSAAGAPLSARRMSRGAVPRRAPTTAVAARPSRHRRLRDRHRRRRRPVRRTRPGASRRTISAGRLGETGVTAVETVAGGSRALLRSRA